MTSEDHHRYRDLLVASLFDDLDEEERIEFQEHLDGCEVCRAEFRELRPAVLALESAVPEDAEEGLPPPPADLEARTFARIVAEARKRKRRRRYAWASGAAAAAVVLFVVGFFALVPALAPVFSGAPTEPVAFSAVPPGVEAEAGLISHTWGTETVLVADGLEVGQTYDVTLTSADGEQVPSGTFVVTEEAPITCNLTAALLREDATRLEVLPEGGEPVLEAELPAVSESAQSISKLLYEQKTA